MRTTFYFERVQVDRLEWIAKTECLQCGQPFLVRRGSIMAVLRAGNEFVGVCCDQCLTAESRAEVERRRAEQPAGTSR